MTQTESVRASARDEVSLDVRFRTGESYEVSVRGHGFTVDQPVTAGGMDTAPTPTELFVASLATCVAFYAGRYLTRHGYSRDGLGVSVDFQTVRRQASPGDRHPVEAPGSAGSADAALAGVAGGRVALHRAQHARDSARDHRRPGRSGAIRSQ